MFQPAAKTGFGAALNGKAVQLAQFVRSHPFGRDAPAVFRIEPHSAGMACAGNRAIIIVHFNFLLTTNSQPLLSGS